jgi:small subunit ribosomal protein S2
MEEEQLLVAKEDYLKAGIHIGTKFKTKSMDQFIYKTRPDGLSVLNLQRIDKRIKIAADFLSQYDPDDILVVSRRENGWKPVKLMTKILGIKSFPGRYPPGILTNPALENYIEAKVLLVVDPWPDRNAINDSMRIGIPIVALCDTNNQANNIDLVIPCNNKGKKSLGIFFYILTREIMKNKKMIKDESEFKYSIEDFTEE